MIQIEKIFQMELGELWNIYNYLLEEQEESDKFEEITQKIKYGIALKIPVSYIINEWFTLHPTVQSVILGKRKYNILQFINEKEAREQTLRKAILQLYDPGDTTKPR